MGKGITGVALSFGQSALLLAVVGGLSHQPLLLLFTIFLGAIMVTGIGFLIGSATRDMMSVLPWSIVAIVLLSIPAIDVMLPGVLTSWIKTIPSYYLVDTVYRVINQGAVWVDVTRNLWILLAAGILSLSLGVIVLRRYLR